MRPETQWHGLERLTYYVLFPALLIQTLVKADLTKVPVAGVGGALLLSVLADVAVVPRAAAPARPRSVDGPAFTSIFQGATRWQTYVALAVSGNLFGDLGLALASVAMVAIIPLVNVFSVVGAGPLRFAGKALGRRDRHDRGAQSADLGLRDRARAQRHRIIPLPKLWHEVADALGRSSLAIGLLVDRRRPAPRRHVPAEASPPRSPCSSSWS